MGRQDVIRSRITLSPQLCLLSHTQLLNSHRCFVTIKGCFLSAIIQLMESYSLSAWPCHCLYNPCNRALLCIYRDNIDNCLRGSSYAKLRGKCFLIATITIFFLLVLFFSSWVGYEYFCFRNLNQLLTNWCEIILLGSALPVGRN